MPTLEISSVAASCARLVAILACLCRPAIAQNAPPPAAPPPPATPAAAASPALPDREAVVATVQAFFDTMTAKDVAGAQRVLIPEATFRYVQMKDGKPVSEMFTTQWWLKALPERKRVWFERMWNPDVHIRGGVIATLWAPYDFWKDGTYDHCGVDACDLVKTPEGWKISACIYTIESTCEASPLGPPKK